MKKHTKKLNKDISDYLITEFDRISTAYFSLQGQLTEFFKVYIALIGVPLTLITAILRLDSMQTSQITLSNLPDIVSGLLITVSFLGLLISLSIISIRLEMLLYARTINLIRRWFVSKEKNKSRISKYLVLPTTDAQPPFFDGGNRGIFWPFILMAILNGVIFGFSVLNLLNSSPCLSIFTGLMFFSSHIFIYKGMANRRESEWNINFPKNLGKLNY